MSTLDDEAVKTARAMKESLGQVETIMSTWLRRNRLAYRILVVDDSQLMRMTLQSLLFAKLGVPVDTADSGDDAVRQWRESRHGVVVMDVQLAGGPGSSGVHVAASLGRGPRIVLISGVADEQLLADTAQALDAASFTKPFDVDKFVETVKKLLDKAARSARA